MSRSSLKAVFIVFLVLGLTPFAGSVYAQEELVEMGLEDILYMEIPVVISATLSERPLDVIPGSMTVITREQIRAYGLRCMADVYEYVPGFYVERSMYGHLQPKARLSPYFKLMIDSHPVNDAYDRYAEPWDYYPLENVEQIEIIRGPGASLWGEDSFVALVNIITNKDKRTSISLTGGEWEHFSANLVHSSDPDQDFSYSLQYNMLDENGDRLYFGRDWRAWVGSMSLFDDLSITPQHNYRAKEMEGGTLV